MKNFYLRLYNEVGMELYGEHITANNGKEAMIKFLQDDLITIDDRDRLEIEELY